MLLKLLVSILLVIFLHLNTITINYQIAPNSILYLKGNTSITDYKCDCEDTFPATKSEVSFNSAITQLSFKNAHLSIKSSVFDCHNFIITRNLKHTLKTDKYPAIDVELLSATSNNVIENDFQVGKTYTFQTKALVTITGKTLPQTLVIKLTKLAENKYKLSSDKGLSMKEYSIVPYVPFNVIKFEDTVTIHFDLFVSEL